MVRLEYLDVTLDVADLCEVVRATVDVLPVHWKVLGLGSRDGPWDVLGHSKRSVEVQSLVLSW